MHRRPRSAPWLRRLSAPLPPRRALALALAVTVVACGGEPAAMTVGEVVYTEDELLGLPERQRELLGTLTGLGLLMAAERTDSLAAPLRERRERVALARALEAERVLDSLGVGDDVLRARYLTDPALELEVRHLIVLSDRFQPAPERAEAQAKAQRALERVRAGEPFPQVAAEVSEEPGAEGREGLLQPGREGAWVPEFWAAASALEPGEVSGVVQTQYGFHVLRLEGRDTVPFEEARPEVVADVVALAGLTPGEAVPPAPPGLAVVKEHAVRAGDSAAPDSLTVATWEGGRLDLADLRRELAALPLERWRTATTGPDAAAAVAREAAAWRAAADRAREAGLAVPATWTAEAESELEARLTGWESFFGFTPGLPAEAVREAALQALGSNRQNVVLARDEVREATPLIRYRVPVRRAGGEATDTDPGAGAAG